MGGKGGDSGSSNELRSAMAQGQAEREAQIAAAQQKQAAAPVKEEAPKAEEPKDDTTKTPTTDTSVGKDNLTGLGDAMVAGLSPGRIQQVKDQTERTAANPQTYNTQYDPYTGTFVGQGPYTSPTEKTGQQV